MQLFISGQGAFLITGTWYLGDMQNNPDIHFTAVPAPAGVKAPLTVGGVDLAWAITSVAKDDATKDLAGQYLDYMVSDEAAEMWAAAGYLPAVALPEGAEQDQDVARCSRGDRRVEQDHRRQRARPLSRLGKPDDPEDVRGQPAAYARGTSMTPEAFVNSLEKDYTTYLASLKK